MCLLQFFHEIAENLFGFESACWPVAFFCEIAENLFGFDLCILACSNFFVKLLKTCLVLTYAFWPVAIFS